MAQDEATPHVIQPRVGGSQNTSEASDGSVAFLQHRVGRFGLVFASFGGFYLAYRLVFILIIQKWDEFNISFFAHAAAVTVTLIMWLLCRGAPRSKKAVRAIETAGVLSIALLYTVMMGGIPLLFNPDVLVTMAITFGCFGRAVYVPSSARRTFLLTAACGLPLFIGTYIAWSTRFEAEAADAYHALLGERLGAHYFARIKTAFAFAWWVITTGMSTLASRVIYGLRAEVRSIRKLGQYQLERKLGEGGMGMVYEASHAMLRRPTAIKLLPPGKAGEQNVARFEREVQLTARLTHPHTVTVFDYGRTPDGVFYYAMELLDGANLSEVVEVDGSQPEGRVLEVMASVAGSLSEAHEIGLIHRDIKPQNIMLCQHGGRQDVTMVLDFGLVKEVATEDGGSVTNANVVTGTPQYLSPEGLTSPTEVDGRSDIYALGAVAYFLLTGEHVFQGNTLVEICGHHLHTAPEPPSERLGRPIDPALEAVILACLQKKPEDRPPSARELLVELRACARYGAWGEEQGSAWWEKHGDEVRTRRSTKRQMSGDQTIAVDLDRTTR